MIFIKIRFLFNCLKVESKFLLEKGPRFSFLLELDHVIKMILIIGGPFLMDYTLEILCLGVGCLIGFVIGVICGKGENTYV